MSTRITIGQPLRRSFRGGFTGAFGQAPRFRLREGTGSAEPLDDPTKNAFAALQRAVNSYLTKFSLAPAEEALLARGGVSGRRLTVDALLGGKTLTAVTAVLTNVATRTGLSVEIPGTITALANSASVLATSISAAARVAPDFRAPAPSTTVSDDRAPTAKPPIRGDETVISLDPSTKKAGFGLFLVGGLLVAAAALASKS